jgi:hypothetical protein
MRSCAQLIEIGGGGFSCCCATAGRGSQCTADALLSINIAPSAVCALIFSLNHRENKKSTVLDAPLFTLMRVHAQRAGLCGSAKGVARRKQCTDEFLRKQALASMIGVAAKDAAGKFYNSGCFCCLSLRWVVWRAWVVLTLP